MNLILFDDPIIKDSLLPLTYTRPVAEIRVGIQKISEKWSHLFQSEIGFWTDDYLSTKFPGKISGNCIIVNGAICPDSQFINIIQTLEPGRGLKKDNFILAYRMANTDEITLSNLYGKVLDQCEEFEGQITIISKPWHIFQKNAEQLKLDFERITKGRKSMELTDPYTVIYKSENVFIEEGAQIKAAIIDAENGPVYIGKNTVINLGAVIRGSLALLDSSEIAMGSKLRGDSTIGPGCKVGGEISNSVFLGNSNKAHDGYLGNSVIGEWCNLGAGTNSSNMKNDYKNIRLWDYSTGRFRDTGSAFCGLIMGDHSKCGINVMFNSGTSIGVACNLYNPGYFRNFIPSFYQGSPQKMETLPVQSASDTAQRMMDRRNFDFTETDHKVLEKVFELTAKYRKN